MFALTEDDRERAILGCADGPASFNAEATALGWHVTSADPLYRVAALEIRQRIDAVFDDMLDETRRNAHEFVWRPPIDSVESLAPGAKPSPHVPAVAGALREDGLAVAIETVPYEFAHRPESSGSPRRVLPIARLTSIRCRPQLALTSPLVMTSPTMSSVRDRSDRRAR
jgi:hypothetical protein